MLPILQKILAKQTPQSLVALDTVAMLVSNITRFQLGPQILELILLSTMSLFLSLCT
jgi:hypothetical protein